jgi:hypothetical protein
VYVSEREKERAKERESERKGHMEMNCMFHCAGGTNTRRFFNMMQTAKNAHWVEFIPEPVQQISARQGPPTTIGRTVEQAIIQVVDGFGALAYDQRGYRLCLLFGWAGYVCRVVFKLGH